MSNDMKLIMESWRTQVMLSEQELLEDAYRFVFVHWKFVLSL